MTDVTAPLHDLEQAANHTPDPDTPLRDQFIELTLEKRGLETKINILKKRIAAVEAALIDELAAREDQSVKSNSGVTVYLIRKIYARAGEAGKPAACQALRAVGLGDLVEESFNTNTLSAHFRERAKAYIAEHGHGASLDELLPERLRGVIHLTEDHKLGLNRG